MSSLPTKHLFQIIINLDDYFNLPELSELKGSDAEYSKSISLSLNKNVSKDFDKEFETINALKDDHAKDTYEYKSYRGVLENLDKSLTVPVDTDSLESFNNRMDNRISNGLSLIKVFIVASSYTEAYQIFEDNFLLTKLKIIDPIDGKSRIFDKISTKNTDETVYKNYESLGLIPEDLKYAYPRSIYAACYIDSFLPIQKMDESTLNRIKTYLPGYEKNGRFKRYTYAPYLSERWIKKLDYEPEQDSESELLYAIAYKSDIVHYIPQLVHAQMVYKKQPTGKYETLSDEDYAYYYDENYDDYSDVYDYNKPAELEESKEKSKEPIARHTADQVKGHDDILSDDDVDEYVDSLDNYNRNEEPMFFMETLAFKYNKKANKYDLSISKKTLSSETFDISEDRAFINTLSTLDCNFLDISEVYYSDKSWNTVFTD